MPPARLSCLAPARGLPAARVRCGRKAHRLSGLFLSLLLAAPAAQALTKAQQADVAALWAQAMAEQTVVLTCAATTTDLEKSLRKRWEAVRQSALASMAAAGWPAGDLAALTAQSAPDALRKPDATPFGTVLAYCRAFPDWEAIAHALAFAALDTETARLLTPAAAP